MEWARAHDDLIALGVKPTRPETGYGYLKTGKALGGATKVDAFVEKPNLARAQEFLAAGNYLWNGGSFVWRVSSILKAFDTFMPEMKKAWDAASGDVARAYPQMTATSIDYGVMEKASNVVTFALDCGWDDVGSWTSLEELADTLKARFEGNVVSAGEVVAVESEGNIVDAPGRLVALLGVRNLIVVEHGGSLLIAPKERAQDIKLFGEKVKKTHPEKA
jgi:mannose-1-phosphate guanylyltransferase